MKVRRRLLSAAVLALLLTGCGGSAPSEGDVEIHVRNGAGLAEVSRELHRAGLVSYPSAFRIYGRVIGAADEIKAGHYRFRSGESWWSLLGAMRRGEVATYPLSIPEGFEVRTIAPRLAELAQVPADSVIALARDTALARELGVPGPTLEGYLFPETYRFARGVSPRAALETMIRRYRAFWGPEERARAEELGLDEREVTTLASIVEKEARVAEERPVIAGVYLNRLARGMRLQADPTVQYALDAPKARLLYSDIDAVAADPYNTYTNAGLPPGPIASPGEAALRAVLWPEEVPYLYFVARPDGSHVFTETQREHVNAKNRIRRERERE